MAYICPIFKWLVCPGFKWHSKTRQFGIQLFFDYLNTRLVQYSDPHFILKSEMSQTLMIAYHYHPSQCLINISLHFILYDSIYRHSQLRGFYHSIFLVCLILGNALLGEPAQDKEDKIKICCIKNSLALRLAKGRHNVLYQNSLYKFIMHLTELLPNSSLHFGNPWYFSNN